MLIMNAWGVDVGREFVERKKAYEISRQRNHAAMCVQLFVLRKLSQSRRQRVL